MIWRHTRKPGRALSEQEKRLFQPYFDGDVLNNARLVEGHVPFWLRKCMNAVVLGDRIHFREGAYQPGTARGVELLGHELTHVQQFRRGMTLLKYLWQSRRGYRNNCYEIEAHAQGAKIRRECAAGGGLLR